MLPNADLFVAMYVRREAVLSSQIEGTQASLTDVLQFEAGGDGGEPERLLNVEDVVSYVRAMNYGLGWLEELPLSLRLVRELHRELIRGVRGEESTPGEFRHSQNWIGTAGSTSRPALRDTCSPASIHRKATLGRPKRPSGWWIKIVRRSENSRSRR